MKIRFSTHRTYDGPAQTTYIEQNGHMLTHCDWFSEWELDDVIYEPSIQLYNKVRDAFGITWTEIMLQVMMAEESYHDVKRYK